jgi:hypothetical protein
MIASDDSRRSGAELVEMKTSYIPAAMKIVDSES